MRQIKATTTEDIKKTRVFLTIVVAKIRLLLSKITFFKAKKLPSEHLNFMRFATMLTLQDKRDKFYILRPKGVEYWFSLRVVQLSDQLNARTSRVNEGLSSTIVK